MFQPNYLRAMLCILDVLYCWENTSSICFSICQTIFKLGIDKEWPGPIFCLLLGVCLEQCSANHTPSYWSNQPCDWLGTGWAFSTKAIVTGLSEVVIIKLWYNMNCCLFYLPFVTMLQCSQIYGCDICVPYLFEQIVSHMNIFMPLFL